MARNFTLLIVLVSAVLLLAGCAAASLTDLEFFVTCKIDGVEVTLAAGPSGVGNLQSTGAPITLDGIPSGFVDAVPNTTILASTAAIDMTEGPDFPSVPGAFWCMIFGLSDVGSFTISSGDGGFMQFTTADGSITYGTNASTIDGSITKFEGVGGVIEGTFSGTWNEGRSGSHEITEGSFRIKRYDPFAYQAG